MPSGIYKRNVDIIKKGDKYNKLTAIKFSHRGRNYTRFWFFRCDCGNEKVICVGDVRSGGTKSCGCLPGIKIHGMSKTRTYKTWKGMRQRCLNKNNHAYKDYGGREITICNEWMKFENFYKDMGGRPEGKSLDRIDNNLGYCKMNCKWSSQKEQCNNRRSNHFLTYKGKTQNIAQWAEELEVKYDMLHMRLKRGWNVEKTLTKNIKIWKN